MLKKIFQNKGKSVLDSFTDNHSPTPSPGIGTGSGLSAGLKDKSDSKPFEINLNDIWKYDNTELVDFIHKYENYTNLLLSKKHEFENEQIVLRERMDLLEKERRRLMQDIEGQKIYIDNLKQSLNEHSLTETNSPLRLPATNPGQPDKKQIEDLIKQKVHIKGIDSSLLDELRLSGDKIVMQLVEVKSIIDANQGESTADDSEDMINVKMQKSFKNDFLQLVDDVELTFQLIIPKFLEINEKIRQKEKDITELLKGDFLESLRQLEEGQLDKFSLDQVNELESKATELRNKLIKTESVISELSGEVKAKNEQLEKARKTNENLQDELTVTKQLLSENIGTSREEIEKKDKDIRNLQDELKKAQEEIAANLAEKFNAEDVIEQAKEGFKAEQVANEKSQEEMTSMVQSLSAALDSLAKEKDNLQKKLSDFEQEKVDVENKLIQEKLKHHQTIGDLHRAKEIYEQAQKDLNEEIENRKADVKKIEDLKKIQAEFDKKSKEYKKSIKRLSQQILDMQSKMSSQENTEKERNTETSEEQSPISQAQANQNREMEAHAAAAKEEEINKKDHVISEQYKKINGLQDELERVTQDLNSLREESKAYKNKNEELASQAKMLQEKREKGLQEITRLTNVIEEIKAKNPSVNITQQRPPLVLPQFTQPTPQKSSMLANQENARGPIKAVHSISIPATTAISKDNKSSHLNKGPAGTYLKSIKSNLNQLYKEVILAITSEKTGGETERMPSRHNTSGRLDSSFGEGTISDNLVRIEKKVNDVMLMLHEYQESIDQ